MLLLVVGVVKVLQSNNINSEQKLDTRVQRQYPIYYTVGDTVHYSDLRAFQDVSTRLGTEFRFHFDSPMFLEEAWTEPKQTIEYYRQQVCEYIEDTYQEITIGYSGGTDSETVLNCFKRRGTKNIHFLHTLLEETSGIASKRLLIQHMRDNIKQKHSSTIQELNWQFTIGKTWHGANANTMENRLADFEHGIFSTDYKASSAWGKNSGKEVITRNKAPRSVMIFGKEKPEIVIEDGWWCFHLINVYFECPFSATDPNNDILCFFTNEHVPELQKKLAFAKAHEMQRIFIENQYEPSREKSMEVSSVSSKHYTRLLDAMDYRGISQFLHNGSTKFGQDYWEIVQRETFQVGKEEKKIQELTDKFFDEVIVDTVDHQFINWQNKSLHGICSKPIKLFPVDKTLYQSK